MMSNKDSEVNQTRREESSSSFLLGVLLGGLIGAGAAMLFAPNSGKEIRNKFNSQAGSLKEKTFQLRDNVLSKTKSLNENVESSEINYISLNDIGTKPAAAKEKNVDETAIRKKLEEAQKAFEEEEFKVTH